MPAPWNGASTSFQRVSAIATRARKAPRLVSNIAACSGATRASPRPMFAVTTGMLPGSSVKCGLPSGWTSPSERSTRPLGTFRTGIPVDASMTVGVPRTIFGLLLPRAITSIQASSSSPLRTRTSARRIVSILTEAGDHLDAGGVADQSLRDDVEIRQGGHDAQLRLRVAGGGDRRE